MDNSTRNGEKPIGIAIIGSGAIAQVHAAAYTEFPALCEIRAVCDLYIDKAQGLIDRNGLKDAKACKDLDEALAAKDIDAVSICLPPGAHAETAIKSLNAGKHVLVEKPMAPSLAECDAMIEAAEKNGKILSPVAQNRYKTPNARVKTIIAEGAAGKILYASVNSLWWRGSNYYDIWWRGTWEAECGGCVTSHAVHHIDLLLWMLGMPERVTAVIANVGHDNSECEDVGAAILEYPGMLAQLAASLVNHDEEQALVFQAERGRLSVPWQTAASKPLPNGFPQEDAGAKSDLQNRYESIPALGREGHPAQIENFLNAIAGKEALDISGKDGRAAMELIMAIYKSSVTRMSVTLPIAAGDLFYSRESMINAMPRFHAKTRSVENFSSSEITLGRDVGK
ncbi:MAG: Gfo/Idh/MocA family oxidoreductase [Treponema sp.]|jgi:predicted dehydrogenase|nr:Gfo/Idh/MocA family oxidoreductase [Treponema sp.]